MEEKSAPRRGRRGISRDDVRRACEALTVQGRRIGPTNVRLELGTGSYGTIVRLLAELRDEEPTFQSADAVASSPD
ncbi:DNA-binding protein [Variovorax sp. RA8]|uniref:DNA-binding protein n=1 Tax=Variovorax sp. (strain JCM 16519 / RA8) TaxID=662548 RepID=UPI000AEB9A32